MANNRIVTLSELAGATNRMRKAQIEFYAARKTGQLAGAEVQRLLQVAKAAEWTVDGILKRYYLQPSMEAALMASGADIITEREEYEPSPYDGTYSEE